MSGIAGHLVSHVVRRGVPEHAYAPHERMPFESLFKFDGFVITAIVLLAFFTLFVTFSIEYTIGNVMARLAMIESSSTTTIIEAAPPAYTDEPDAPLEDKKPLLEEADIEIVTIKHKPITSSIRTTVRHLHRVGGMTARWRGLRESFIYHALLNIMGHVFQALFSSAGVLQSIFFGFTLATVLMCRFRMIWTHAMIAAPNGKPWYRRFCARKGTRALLLPSLFYVLTTQLALLTPIITWFVLGVFDLADPELLRTMNGPAIASAVFRVLAGPAAGFAVLVFMTLPASIALARMEACLLPEGEETIVPFDRLSIMGDLDIMAKGAPTKLFIAAWRSVSFGTRFRVMGVYAKMIAIQTVVIFANLLTAVAIVYITSPEKVHTLIALARN